VKKLIEKTHQTLGQNGNYNTPQKYVSKFNETTTEE
jgi:hypothetical protein